MTGRFTFCETINFLNLSTQKQAKSLTKHVDYYIVRWYKMKIEGEKAVFCYTRRCFHCEPDFGVISEKDKQNDFA